MTTVDEQTAELVRRAFDGEVLGVALFDRLASTRATSSPPEQLARLEAARAHEAATLEHARTLADDLGVDVGDGSSARADGEHVADALSSLAWDDLVAAVVSGTGVYRDLYADLSSVCSHPAVAELVAHEPALHRLLLD